MKEKIYTKQVLDQERLSRFLRYLFLGNLRSRSASLPLLGTRHPNPQQDQSMADWDENNATGALGATDATPATADPSTGRESREGGE